MNKSQLRKLAREFALGKLDDNEYRRQRGDLLRGIVDGSVAIIRETPPPPPAPPPDPTEATIEATLEIEPESSKPSALYIGIGIVLVGALVWFFLPSKKPEQMKDTTIVERSLPVPEVSPARVVVEEFVASRDWSEFGVSRFKERWSGLSDADRTNALTERWFNELTNAISEEIKTQNALLDFDTSENAVRTGNRLAQLSEFLGVGGDVTAFKGSGAATPPEAPQQTATPEPEPAPAPEPSPQTTESQAPEQPVSAQNSAADNRVSSRKSVRTVSGLTWLDDQPADAFTLQLFAVNHLEKIQELIASNPTVDLQVLVSAHSEPRYRVIHGAFESADAARAAHAALSESIRRAQPTPLVKTIGDLRIDLVNGDWIGSVDANKYTLQLFATDNSDNARQLVSKYPALKLSLLDTKDVRSRFRVLYGTFDNEFSAKSAVSGLPADLLRDAGKPLIKSVGELQAARR